MEILGSRAKLAREPTVVEQKLLINNNNNNNNNNSLREF
jgi:hypothetical protein